jgi:hypothetical protein
LLKGDEVNYRATCERFLEQFEQVSNPGIAHNVAWACALAPNAVKDLGRAVQLAKRAVKGQPANAGYLNTLGAILYRANDMDGTIKLLGKSSSLSTSSDSASAEWVTLFDRLFLVMAYHGLGRVDDSKDLLEAVIQRLDADEQNKNGPARALPTDTWQRRELNLLRNEAERLIKPKR